MAAVAKQRQRKTSTSQAAQRQPRKGSGATGVREEFGLTRKLFARMTGLSERTVASWENGVRLNDSGQRQIIAVDRLLRAMAEVVHKGAVAAWLVKPNAAFDGLKPVEVLERGEADRLWRMIYFMGSGVAS
jgi:DNA-binding transcriptional regulator YiaG